MPSDETVQNSLSIGDICRLADGLDAHEYWNWEPSYRGTTARCSSRDISIRGYLIGAIEERKSRRRQLGQGVSSGSAQTEMARAIPDASSIQGASIVSRTHVLV